MAKTSKIVRSKQRTAMVARYAKVRAELKEAIRNPKTSDEDREASQLKLNKLPRNSSAVRLRNRCELTGRARGYYRKFRLCRHKLREMALKGELPGVTKASW